MENKPRNILHNLGLALLATPLTSLIIIVTVALVGAVDNLITKIQRVGFWWLVPIIFGFIPSFIYFTKEQSFKIYKKRKEIAKSLLLYWRDQLKKLNMPSSSERDLEEMEEQLLKRVKIWAWSNPELWKKNFPYERYSPTLFGIVDNLIEAYQKRKSKKWSEFIWETNLKSGR